MATLGTPTKDESGKWYQRWYPAVGDIRPEWLEYFHTNNLTWLSSLIHGQRVSESDAVNGEYRIPSTYTPPAGWYCVDDWETVQNGDAVSHWADGGQHSEPQEMTAPYVHMTVEKLRAAIMPNGGWVLRREPIQEQSCKSESVNTALEKVGSSSVCHVSTGPESGTGANNATAPVAWQFRKQPMERQTEMVLIEASDTIAVGDLWWTGSRWKHVELGDVGTKAGASPVCRPRPVYAPLPTRLEDVPDGRVFEWLGDWYWKHGNHCGCWNPASGYIDPQAVSGTGGMSKFTITEYVAELMAVE